MFPHLQLLSFGGLYSSPCILSGATLCAYMTRHCKGLDPSLYSNTISNKGDNSMNMHLRTIIEVGPEGNTVNLNTTFELIHDELVHLNQ